MTEEIKVEESKVEIKPEIKTEEKPVTDFKVAEIWIRDNQLKLEALPEFWKDKIRAIGLLELCKDIVKEAKLPDDKPRIIPAKGSFLNGVRNFVKRKK